MEAVVANMNSREMGDRQLLKPSVRRLVSLAVGLASISVLRPDNIEPVLLVWLLVLLTQVFFVPSRRLAGVLFLSLTLYASTAYLALKYARQNFEPWPSLQVVQSVTALDLRCVFLAVILVEAVFGFERLGAVVSRASVTCRNSIGAVRSSLPDFAVSILFLTIGIFDWLKIASIGLGNVLGGERRQYATQLLLGGNHNVQVMVMAATVFLVCRIVTRSIGPLPILSLAVLWLPFLLVGSRKEAITTGAICIVMLGGLLSKRALLVFGGFSAVVFLSPSLKSGNIYDSLHEFILPQYMHFSMAMGLVPPDLGGTFLERSQFLVPDILRLTQIVDFGRAFYRLGITGVGLGASPFGEAQLNSFFHSTELSFAFVFLIAVTMMIFLARWAPVYSVVAFGLLIVFGRSDFWTYMFFVCYVSAVVFILSKFPASSKFPVHPLHRGGDIGT
ncbi:hypothetical protein [Arthrobacter sp. SLBN-112]|uniref:hypothetical protein n=1 Tax=Arthrobacter sp. SLBN-112 TaxID=2768452 RepID=UPI00114EBC1E|nr:hypothetical protein [Arthrobacter sp. SLBN-112]